MRDANGNLVIANRLLAFRLVEGKHDGENLANIAFGVLKEAGILHKVVHLCRRFVGKLTPIQDWAVDLRQCIEQQHIHVSPRPANCRRTRACCRV